MKKLLLSLALSSSICATASVNPFGISPNQLATPQPISAESTLNVCAASRADEPEAITEQPAGEVVETQRRSLQYLSIYGMLFTRGVTASATYTVDGENVYFKNYISAVAGEDVWIKGHIDGETVTVDFPQIAYGEINPQTGEALYYSAYVLQEAEEENAVPVVSDTQTVTYSYVDGVITQTDSYIVGLCIPDEENDNQPAFLGYGDAQVVYTPFNEVPQVLPEGLTTEKWAMTWDGGGQFVDVAIDGDKVWLTGLVKELPDAAFVGTIDGDKVVFDAKQYLGNYQGAYYLYFMPIKYTGLTGTEAMALMDELVMSYDPENRVMAAAQDEGFDINAGVESVLYLTYYQAPRIYYQGSTGKPMTPAAPGDLLIKLQDEQYWDDYGFGTFQFNLPIIADNGDLLDVSELYFEVYADGDPIEFDPDFYEMLSEPMVEVPATFTDGWDFYVSGTTHTVYLWFTGYERLGVQSIYKAGGETRRSDIVYDDGTVVGIQSLEQSAAPSVYYDLMGRRIAQPMHGIYVKVQDGKASKVRL